MKSQKQDSTGVAPLKYKNQLFSGASDRAVILSRQFKSVFNKDADPETKNISTIDQITQICLHSQ